MRHATLESYLRQADITVVRAANALEFGQILLPMGYPSEPGQILAQSHRPNGIFIPPKEL
jgi:hypothetical protein